MLTVDANVWIAAADNGDPYFQVSRRFLSEITRKRLDVFLPSLARVEIGCALSRRWQNPSAARRLVDALLNPDFVTEVPLEQTLLRLALQRGIDAALCGADAFYLATAEMMGT